MSKKSEESKNLAIFQGKFMGPIIGLIFGFGLIYLGWWKMLILTVAVVIGFVVGKYYDDRTDLEIGDEFEERFEDYEPPKEINENGENRTGE